MDDLLQQGITTYRAGKRNEARTIFATVVKQSPNNEHAWGWLNNVCNTDQERMYCLKQMVRINPKNEKAHQLLKQLIAPPIPSSKIGSSIPSIPQAPPSGAIATGKNSSFTRTQLFVLLGLVITIFSIFAVAILYLFAEKETSIIAATPTKFVTSSANLVALPTNVLPTATLIPTYAYLPTSTPLPSPTSFLIATLAYPTSQPQQAQDSSAPANPVSVNSGSSCSADLEYAAAMHQYYSDAIDYIHSPSISLYQSWIDEAIRNRDALGLVKAQRSLDNEKAQVEAEKTSENKRYKAERASINSNC